MKKTILALALLLVVGCNNRSGVIKDLRPQVDSSIIEYSTDKLGVNVRTTFAYKVIKDVNDTTRSEDGTFRVVLEKDTTYFVPISVQMFDSLKHPVLDSLKRPKYEVKFFPLPKDFLIEDKHKTLPLKEN